MDAKTIIEPWMNGDPCEGCEDCAKICRKLQDRIDSAIAERDRKIERLQEHCAEMTTRCIEKEHENEVLREALRRIADGPRDVNKTYAELFTEVKIEARTALGEGKPLEERWDD